MPVMKRVKSPARYAKPVTVKRLMKAKAKAPASKSPVTNSPASSRKSSVASEKRVPVAMKAAAMKRQPMKAAPMNAAPSRSKATADTLFSSGGADDFVSEETAEACDWTDATQLSSTQYCNSLKLIRKGDILEFAIYDMCNEIAGSAVG